MTKTRNLNRRGRRTRTAVTAAEDELFIRRLVNMETHPKVGDLPIVKMFETGYKRTGDTQPTRISAEAQASVTSQLYAKRLYLPEWRKEPIDTQPIRLSAEAKASVTPQLYAKRLFLPEWRKEAIDKIQRAELEES